MSKKKILTIALILCLIAIMAMGTLAYFTDSDTADNVFTVGNVKIELTETEWNPDAENVRIPIPERRFRRTPA